MKSVCQVTFVSSEIPSLDTQVAGRRVRPSTGPGLTTLLAGIASMAHHRTTLDPKMGA